MGRSFCSWKPMTTMKRSRSFCWIFLKEQAFVCCFFSFLQVFSNLFSCFPMFFFSHFFFPMLSFHVFSRSVEISSQIAGSWVLGTSCELVVTLFSILGLAKIDPHMGFVFIFGLLKQILTVDPHLLDGAFYWGMISKT